LVGGSPRPWGAGRVQVGRAALHDALLTAHRRRNGGGDGGALSSGKSGEGSGGESVKGGKGKGGARRGGGARAGAGGGPFVHALTDAEVAELESLFTAHVLVVDNHLRRDSSATYENICPR